jgi:protein-tyrosine phosphatase
VSRWFESYGFAAVHDRLLIGAYPLDGDDVGTLASISVRRVLNLVEDDEYPAGSRLAVRASLEAAEITEYRLQLTDFGRLPADRLETAVSEVATWVREGTLGYVHCRAGWQRSAAVAAGVVAVVEHIDIEAALAYVQRRKPSAEPLPHQRDDLVAWWDSR